MHRSILQFCTLTHYSLACSKMEMFAFLVLTTLAIVAHASKSPCSENNRNCSLLGSEGKLQLKGLNRNSRSSDGEVNLQVHNNTCDTLKRVCSENRCEKELSIETGNSKGRRKTRTAIAQAKALNTSATPNWQNFLVGDHSKSNLLKQSCGLEHDTYEDNGLWGKTLLMNKKIVNSKRENPQIPRMHFNMQTVTYEVKTELSEEKKKIVTETLDAIASETCLKFKKSLRMVPAHPNDYQFHLLFLGVDECLEEMVGGFDDDVQFRPIGIVIFSLCHFYESDPKRQTKLFRAILNAFGQVFQPSEEQRKRVVRDDMSDHEFQGLAVESYLFVYFSPDMNRMDISKPYETILDPLSSMDKPSFDDYVALNNYFCNKCKSANGKARKSMSGNAGPQYDAFDRIQALTCGRREIGFPYQIRKCVGVLEAKKSDIVYCDGFSGKFGQLSHNHKEIVLLNNAPHCREYSEADSMCKVPEVSSYHHRGIATLDYSYSASSTVKIYYTIASCEPDYSLVGLGCGIEFCKEKYKSWSYSPDAPYCKRIEATSFSRKFSVGSSVASGRPASGYSPKQPEGFDSSTSGLDEDPQWQNALASRMTWKYQPAIGLLIVGTAAAVLT